ncbi:tRNA (guanine-N(7)-)-methyltransferase non-catalytic subunit trm82 [Naganishia albida]|nr:tRNA (guanine-N(7)-)-methyltransferase non-catalytic subunit trm82 [Naganishia albida]
MTSTTIPCPVSKLAASDDILALTSGTQTLVFDIASGKRLPASSPLPDEKILSNAAQLKVKSSRLVATGYAPVKLEGETEDGVVDVQPVVASATEDKILRLVQADTGVVFYERTLIKKASYLTIEEDGTVMVSDKNGDVFAYPFVNDAEISSQTAKPRPDPVSLAGDPSLNPDANLLVGHVSIVTAHAVTKDKRQLITVDRDEHIRVNRYPETYVIDKFIWGHKDFVSTLALSETDDDIIHTAGGDAYILTSRISTGETLSALPISHAIKPNRTVRAPLRKHKRRVHGQKQAMTPVEDTVGVAQRARELPLRGWTEEQWTSPPEDWGLPDGEGICVGKSQIVGEHLVFFGEGASAIHSVPAASLSSRDTAAAETISTFETTCPVLDFCRLPSDGAQRILVSLDPAWRQRIDGGLAFFPPKPAFVPRTNRKRGGKEPAAGEPEGKEAPVEAEAREEEMGLTDEDVQEMVRDVFMVLEIGSDGKFVDVTSAHRQFVEGIQNELQKVNAKEALLLPAYGNLAFLPKWPGFEEDDELITPENIEELQAKAASAKKGANAKRQIGRLKAQGIAVDVPKTEEAKMKKAEANRERKKRRKEQASGRQVAEASNEEAKSEGPSGEASAAATEAPADKMEVDAEGKVGA